MSKLEMTITVEKENMVAVYFKVDEKYIGFHVNPVELEHGTDFYFQHTVDAIGGIENFKSAYCDCTEEMLEDLGISKPTKNQWRKRVGKLASFLDSLKTASIPKADKRTAASMHKQVLRYMDHGAFNKKEDSNDRAKKL